MQKHTFLPFRQKYLFLILMLIVSVMMQSQTDKSSRYTQKSVLAEGNWYKIRIPSTGIYKLTYNDLKNMGLSNPSKVKVYGYGGWILDEKFTSYIDDLPQVAIWMSNTPENFGANDYILFYARGDIKWVYNQSLGEFEHTQNTYSTDSYYFVTESDSKTNIMANVGSNSLAGPTATVTSFTDYYLHEKDMFSVCESGREYFGEKFSVNKSQNFSVPLEGITSDPATFRVNFISRTLGAKLKVSLNNSLLKEFTVPAYNPNNSNNGYVKANALNAATQLVEAAENNVFNLSYVSSNTDVNVHLNFFRITYNRSLKPYGAVTLFRSTVKSGGLQFKISQASGNIRVFDITNHLSPVLVKTDLSGTDLSFTASNNDIKEYAMVDLSKNIPSPVFVAKVKNQNLHGMEVKDMVIVVRKSMAGYAEQLKQIHENHDGLESVIVDPEDIYNEFSSGKPDATAIRWFMKMFYDRAATDSEKPKYLLLFGDGTYDNRLNLAQNVWTESDKNAMLLTFQTPNSIDELQTYTTDDYFGFLDDNEIYTSADLDIGIGRLPVKTAQEAMGVVNKIKEYLENKDSGMWQNNICFLADDAVKNDTISIDISEAMHAKYSEAFAQSINKNHPEYIVSRVYCDMYERITTANGVRYPAAHKTFIDKINSGLLLLNFTGHASDRDWTHEYILVNSDIDLLNNKHYPFIITAACDFGRFDANQVAGGELFLTKSNSGAIGLLTAARVVSGPNNKNLNEKVLHYLFNKIDGKSPRLGDVVRMAKRSMSNTESNKLRFLLLGDPALRLAIPDNMYKAKIVSVNNEDPDSQNIQLKALGSVSLEGEIVDKNGDLMPDFTGTLDAVIYDSEIDLKTRGNTRYLTGVEQVMIDYKDFTNIIYMGKVEVSKGKFTIGFTTPKDILYLDKPGKMSFFAYDQNNSLQAQGSFTNYIVGGTDENAVEEFDPPMIEEIYLNRPDFKSGGTVNSTPFFKAKVSDKSGINLSSGIGHNISILIDNDKSYNLSPYFVNTGSSVGEGYVGFSIPQLEEGEHSLLFKVWDVWNNSANEYLYFKVIENYTPLIHEFSIDGNPVGPRTNLIVYTDLAGSRAAVRYDIFSLTGAICLSKLINTTVDSSGLVSVEWDSISSSGVALNPGMYICRVTIRGEDGETATSSQKLIVPVQ